MKVLPTALIVLGWAWSSAPVIAQHLAPGGLLAGESTLRTIATNRPLPRFPAPSLAGGAQGVAVAYVEYRPDGTMEHVDVLEAPDAAIGAAVQSALGKWRITPTPSDAGRPRHYEGRITFYFRIVKGRGLVLNPEQVDGNRDVWEAIHDQASRPAASDGPTVMRASGAGITEIDAEEAARLVRSRNAVLVDVRERDEFGRSHMPGAIVMPAGEIFVRSRAEIDPARPVVVDCSQGDLTPCRGGARLFVRRGFREVMTIVP
jgi:rhodanese-related sulfurtransferase